MATQDFLKPLGAMFKKAYSHCRFDHHLDGGRWPHDAEVYLETLLDTADAWRFTLPWLKVSTPQVNQAYGVAYLAWGTHS